MTTLNRPGAPDGHVCGIDAAMEVIGGKWKVLILWALDEHPSRRFGELRRLLPGVTEKVLASHLRELEADGIVRRVSYEEVPPRVEYSLTDDGVRLNAALVPLAAWGSERTGAEPAGAEPTGAEPTGAEPTGAREHTGHMRTAADQPVTPVPPTAARGRA